MSGGRRGTGPWARYAGVTLTPIEQVPDTPGLLQALADGLERGLDAAAAEESRIAASEGQATLFAVRAAGAVVALLALRQRSPHAAAATVTTIAVDPAQRGHAFGTRALLAAERRLAREGISELYACVPRTNGRGLYFMLRAGFEPVLDDPARGNVAATRFRRRAPERSEAPTS